MTITDITNEAQSLIASDNVPGSLEFAEKLEKSLFDNNIREANPNAYRELSKIIFQLYVTAIPNLDDELLFNIISFNLIEALNPMWPSERDLASRIESKYSIYPIELIKEMMRKDILDLVKKNNQLIGGVPLRLSQDEPQAKPTVQNWILYYDRSTGSTEVKNFKRSVFMSSDAVVQTLNPQEKETLRKVIYFYDYLQTDDTVLYADLHEDKKPEPQNDNLTYTPPTSSETTNLVSNTSSRPHNTVPTENNVNNISSNTNIAPINIAPINTQVQSPQVKSNLIKKSPAPIVLSPKPQPIPQNLVNLKK